MDISDRRDGLQTATNPNKTLDYLITIDCFSVDETRRILVRYIPDKLILEKNTVDVYLTKVPNDLRIEELATNLLDDLNNELVCRWMQVCVFEESSALGQHQVIVEDKQPQWENAYMIDRLSKI
jgi:7-cyano-7-deazaguanine reductase